MAQYRLQALFEIRERAKKEAEDHYAQEKRRENEERKKLEDMKQKLADMKVFRDQKKREYFEEMQKSVLSIDKIGVGNRHIDSLIAKEDAFAEKIEQQKDTLKRAEEACAKALETMLEATKQFKALEKHKEKWATQEKKERQRKEEEAVDDIAQAKYFSEHKNRG